MVNPYSGIISTAHKELYNNLIDAIIEDGALVRPCKFVLTGTKKEMCPNCTYSPTNKKSTGIYRPGGPSSFTSGQICPVCNGLGKRDVEAYESHKIAVIWNPKGWSNLGFDVKNPEGNILTICHTSLLPLVKRCQYIIPNTDIAGHITAHYQRDGEPRPAGFGDDRYTITLWKKIG